MYLKYFHLRKPPFGVTPDPDFFYLTPGHREALAAILYGLENRRGFISLIGEVGVGKTTVLRAILNRLNPNRVKALYLFNPELSFPALIRTIFQELGIPQPTGDVDLAVQALFGYLIEWYRQGIHVVLFIDEAQRMPVDTLERLRVLSNLETTKDKLLQIVLCGQPEFEEMLARLELRQLRSRIAMQARLQPLDRKESIGYIEHRLSKVRYGRMSAFSPGAIRRIVRYAQGSPRLLNIACENVLIAGYASQERPISSALAREVIADLKGRRKSIMGAAAQLFAASFSVLSYCVRPWRALKRDRKSKRGISAVQTA